MGLASDKLFYWLFQTRPDRIVPLLDDLPADAGGYRFMAPVLKAREHRLDGLFLPPADRPELPAVILEAQMASDSGFLRRLYAECARLIQQEMGISHWRVVVLCPGRHLNFGDPEPVAEFLEHRVRWIELQPARQPPHAPALQRALALLVEPESDLAPTVRRLTAEPEPSPTAREDLADAITAIVLTRLIGRSIQEICQMSGLTVEDITQSVAYREIFGLGLQEGREEGRQEGRREGRQAEAAALALRQLWHRVGALHDDQEAAVRALPIDRLEVLAVALLDFKRPDDLTDWLAANS